MYSEDSAPVMGICVPEVSLYHWYAYGGVPPVAEALSVTLLPCEIAVPDGVIVGVGSPLTVICIGFEFGETAGDVAESATST